MKTRSPARRLRANLMWTRHGAVWATWRLDALPYGFSPRKQKEEARDLHQALFRSLPGESLLLGVCADLDPAAVVQRMIEGVDLSEHSEWARECEATLDTLDELPIGQRHYFLSVPLGNGRGLARASEPMRAALGDIHDSLGLPVEMLPESQVQRRMEQARQLEALIPAPFNPRPTTPAQMMWLQLHSQRRGLGIDPDVPDAYDNDISITRSGTCIPEPVLDERGLSDLNRLDIKTLNPMDRRFVKVTSPGAPGVPHTISYQSLMVLADVPAKGVLFPGGEFIGRIDESGVEADWGLRLHVRSQDTVAAANRRALNNLNDQYRHRGEANELSQTQLDRAAQDLKEYIGVLTSDEMEVEVLGTWMLATAGETPQIAEDKARALSTYMAANSFKLSAPPGYQSDMWWALTPGVPTAPIVRDYAQLMTSRSLSALVPMAGTEIGDMSGSLFGICITTPRAGVVFVDLAGQSDRDGAGCVAFSGDQGGGKSVGMKKLGGDVVDMGGGVFVIDSTKTGEYVPWAESITDATVIDLANPEVSGDPLRVFGLVIGSRIARSFFTLLLDVKPMSALGALLNKVLTPSYLAAHGLTGCGDVLEHIKASQLAADAPELAERMDYFAGDDGYARVIFDQSLPPMPMTSRAIVWRTHIVKLPTEKELEIKHLFDQLPGEKIFGRALYALLMGMAREICFSDPDDFWAFICDEVSHINISPEGRDELVHFARNCRKQGAGLIIGTQDPHKSMGDEVLRGLIRMRVVTRTIDKGLAKRALEWIGADPEDEDMVHLVTEDLSPHVRGQGVREERRGECLMRDFSGSIGKVKILLPSEARRRKAVLTTTKIGGRRASAPLDLDKASTREMAGVS